MNIIISRTDNLGDVMLTLPMCGIIKEKFPQAKVFFIGKAYTKPLIDNCAHIDEFIDREEIISGNFKLEETVADVIIFVFPDKEIARLAKKAKIPTRIGTSHRLFHWLYCNKLVNFSRKKSDLHEAQLNLKLLEPLGIKEGFFLTQLADYYGFNINKNTGPKNKIKIIIHPKSKGSAREWKLENYFNLIKLLPEDKFEVYVTGTKEEGEKIRSEMPGFFDSTHATDLTGKLSLAELINFIGNADALIACSTGPLHIAAAQEIVAIGLYPPMRPIHPGRWAPIGKKAAYFVLEKDCNDCRKSNYCACINSISPFTIHQHLMANLPVGK